MPPIDLARSPPPFCAAGATRAEHVLLSSSSPLSRPARRPLRLSLLEWTEEHRAMLTQPYRMERRTLREIIRTGVALADVCPIELPNSPDHACGLRHQPTSCRWTNAET